METHHLISIIIIAIIMNYSLLFRDIEPKLDLIPRLNKAELVKDMNSRSTNKNDSVTKANKDTTEIFNKDSLAEAGGKKYKHKNKNTEIWGDEIYQMPNSEIIP